MVDRYALRLSSALFIVGLIFTIGSGILHPAQENPNNHAAVFAEYASSANWIAVHLGQFVAFAVIAAGLFILFYALNLRAGWSGWVNRLAIISAGVTLALYAVLQAVDGVVLKRAVDAWAAAPAAEKAARFASAEVIRWLEEGTRSYYDFLLGLTLLLFGIVIISSARVPRPVGYLMGLSGLSYLVQAWVLGLGGFSPAHGLTQLPAYVFLLAWMIWLAAYAWRMKPSAEKGMKAATG